MAAAFPVGDTTMHVTVVAITGDTHDRIGAEDGAGRRLCGDIEWITGSVCGEGEGALL